MVKNSSRLLKVVPRRIIGYNPGIIIMSDMVVSQCIKEVGIPIPHAQHRSIFKNIISVVKPNEIPF